MGFTSAPAIENYLPAGGTAASLPGPKFLCNPTRTPAGVFGGQVLAMYLNVRFGDLGVLPDLNGVHLGDLVYVSGPCAGFTVREVLARAQALLSGGLVAGGTCNTITQLNEAADGLNNNFDNCTQNLGLLRLP
jgi:hypothetical protein